MGFDPPRLLYHYPENETWLCTDIVEVAISIEENESGVNVQSIRYSIHLLNTIGEDIWYTINENDIHYQTEDNIIVIVFINLNDGRFIINWSISDIVGNTLAFNHSVYIDLTNIQFNDFSPTGWVNSLDVNCSINITDIAGSGIKGDSLQYSLATDNKYMFSEWQLLPEYPNVDKLTVQFKITGIEGKNNNIRFRGRDIAGNQLLTSKIFSIWIS